MSHRILIVTPLVPPEPGGPSYYSISLKEALEQKGNEVKLIAFKEVRHYPSGFRHLLFLYKVLWSARNVDALIMLDTVSVAIPSVIAGWLLGKKMVVRVGGDFVWERYVERTGEKVLLSEFYSKKIALLRKEKVLMWLQKKIVCKLAHHVVFNTSWQRDLWKEPYALPDSKTGVIQNAVKDLKKVHIGGNAFLCAWRSTAFKNVDTLERAFQLVREKCSDAELLVYKDIPREELYEYMIHARALVIPSLTELSPNMALEALSMGLPVLITKDCGARDVLEGYVTWIDPRSESDIAEKMSDAMDPKKYAEMVKGANLFSISRTYDVVAEEFLSLLKNNPRMRGGYQL